MNYQGIDTAAKLTAAQAKILRSEGVSFVARYLVPEKYGKALTAQEAAILRENGLAVMLCWETTAKRMLGGAAAGAEDGAKARELAQAMGVPMGTCIYFAADWDVKEAEIPIVESYYRAARIACGEYNAGVYGGQRVIQALSSVTEWLWQCIAWTDSIASFATVIQYQWQKSPDALALSAKVGVAVDLDSAATTAGMWLPKHEKEEKPMKKNWKEFFTAAGIRALRTFAQSFVSFVAVGAAISEVQWLRALSVSVVAAVLSILTSIATGLPELDK